MIAMFSLELEIALTWRHFGHQLRKTPNIAIVVIRRMFTGINAWWTFLTFDERSPFLQKKLQKYGCKLTVKDIIL